MFIHIPLQFIWKKKILKLKTQQWIIRFHRTRPSSNGKKATKSSTLAAKTIWFPIDRPKNQNRTCCCTRRVLSSRWTPTCTRITTRESSSRTRSSTWSRASNRVARVGIESKRRICCRETAHPHSNRFLARTTKDHRREIRPRWTLWAFRRSFWSSRWYHSQHRSMTLQAVLTQRQKHHCVLISQAYRRSSSRSSKCSCSRSRAWRALSNAKRLQMANKAVGLARICHRRYHRGKAWPSHSSSRSRWASTINRFGRCKTYATSHPPCPWRRYSALRRSSSMWRCANWSSKSAKSNAGRKASWTLTFLKSAWKLPKLASGTERSTWPTKQTMKPQLRLTATWLQRMWS